MISHFNIVLIILFFSLKVFTQTLNYLESSLPIEDRVNELIERMTLDEKIGQMTQADHAAVSDLEDVKNYYLGSILSGGSSDPSPENTASEWANLYDSFQSKALETRLGIPIIYGIDAVHGHSNVTGAVIFPHNIGLGATRNSDLAEDIARITAIEIAATGIDWTFAPCIAVPRDERWGRTYEGFGETPELAEILGSAAIRGFQGDSLSDPTSIAACAKHYVGDGGTISGIDQGNAEISEQELRAIHLPGYISAIESDVKTVMASYNSWNGSKLHGNSYLINDVLKDELGFEGFVVSDWKAIDQLPGDYTSDVENSINAGIDMVMVPNNYIIFFNTLKSLVDQNKISNERIDDAVRRILRVKFELGLFENPLADRSLLSSIGKQEHRDIARQSVRESQVLLKKNDNVLPLPKTNAKILVAGEHADNIGLQCGGWTIQWQGASGEITEGTTILQGLKKIAPNVEFVYNEDGSFENSDADYIIAVIGEEPYAEGEGDRDDLNLKNSQIRMVRELQQLGIPVITLLISGRPMIINPVLHNSDVFIASWLPGTEGDGIAEILFGDYLPSGVLPVSWQKSMDQIPQNIGDQNYDPLFPYGFGITSLENSELASSPVLNSALLMEDGLQIELSFNKSMNNATNSQAEFIVTDDNSNSINILNFELSKISSNIIILEVEEEVDKDANLTIAYQNGNLRSEDEGILNIFTGVPVINYRLYARSIHIIPGRIEAEDYSNMSGVQTENTSDVGGGLNVGWIDDGDWLEYEIDFQSTGTYFGIFRVSSESEGGTLNFSVDDNMKFTSNIPVTNGWQNWTNISQFVDLEIGKHTVRLTAEKGGFNLNWFEFSSVTDIQNEQLITNYFLNQNYPNPFNPSTEIEYQIGEHSFVELIIYDALGRKIKSLIRENQKPGTYSVNFNARNLSSGIYYYQLKTEDFSQSRKLVVLK